MEKEQSLYRVATREGGNPLGRGRVFFTCHPADTARFFSAVCRELWQAQDCAVYYTEDMTAPLPEREEDLSQMNLLVLPVTHRLLTQSNRAMDEDFPFAMA